MLSTSPVVVPISVEETKDPYKVQVRSGLYNWELDSDIWSEEESAIFIPPGAVYGHSVVPTKGMIVKNRERTPNYETPTSLPAPVSDRFEFYTKPLEPYVVPTPEALAPIEAFYPWYDAGLFPDNIKEGSIVGVNELMDGLDVRIAFTPNAGQYHFGIGNKWINMTEAFNANAELAVCLRANLKIKALADRVRSNLCQLFVIHGTLIGLPQSRNYGVFVDSRRNELGNPARPGMVVVDDVFYLYGGVWRSFDDYALQDYCANSGVNKTKTLIQDGNTFMKDTGFGMAYGLIQKFGVEWPPNVPMPPRYGASITSFGEGATARLVKDMKKGIVFNPQG